MLCCAGGLSLPGPLRVCVEWIVHSVFGLLCIWRQVEALINVGLRGLDLLRQLPSSPLCETRHGLGPLIPPEANRSHRLRLST